jgi:hypothetical protein
MRLGTTRGAKLITALIIYLYKVYLLKPFHSLELILYRQVVRTRLQEVPENRK